MARKLRCHLTASTSQLKGKAGLTQARITEASPESRTLLTIKRTFWGKKKKKRTTGKLLGRLWEFYQSGDKDQGSKSDIYVREGLWAKLEEVGG